MLTGVEARERENNEGLWAGENPEGRGELRASRSSRETAAGGVVAQNEPRTGIEWLSWRGMIGFHSFVDTNNSKGLVRVFADLGIRSGAESAN